MLVTINNDKLNTLHIFLDLYCPDSILQLQGQARKSIFTYLCDDNKWWENKTCIQTFGWETYWDDGTLETKSQVGEQN